LQVAPDLQDSDSNMDLECSQYSHHMLAGINIKPMQGTYFCMLGPRTISLSKPQKPKQADDHEQQDQASYVAPWPPHLSLLRVASNLGLGSADV